MKKFIALLLTFSLLVYGFGQVPAYYSSIDFSQTGLPLKEDLSDLVTTTHTSPSTYSEVWDILKQADLDPENSSVVLLMYGYNDADGDVINDRTRDKDNNGGSPGQWNREHVFPKSLGSPDLGTSGPGSDPHNLRASDVQANGNRSNRKFASGSGNAGTTGSNWYPGDEWKGDAARIVMYMYLRYDSRCLPNAVAVGSTNAVDANMINLLLDWNAEDPVSDFEINRNNEIFEAIGNRNPFIDNPAIATRIWGGAEAEDTWGSLSINDYSLESSISFYPNPVTTNTIFVQTTTANPIYGYSIYSLSGQVVIESSNLSSSDQTYAISTEGISNGMYVLNLMSQHGLISRRIVIK